MGSRPEKGIIQGMYVCTYVYDVRFEGVSLGEWVETREGRSSRYVCMYVCTYVYDVRFEGVSLGEWVETRQGQY